MEVVYLIIGVVLGGAVGYLIAKSRKTEAAATDDSSSELKAELQVSRSLLDESKVREKENVRVLEEQRQQLIGLSEMRATLEQQVKNLMMRLAEMEQDEEQKLLAFTNVANKILEDKTQKFTDQNKQNLDSLLKPLGDKIEKFEKKVEETNKETVERTSALREQLNNLKELNRQITEETTNLTNALKGDSKMQGNWGEIVLERILEKSGLEKGREYYTQNSVTTDEGQRFRPDVVVKLPDNKNIVIDSKVSLTAFERLVNAETDEEREGYLKEHLISFRSHINGLSDKNYNDLFEGGALDYVLMFVPIESAFSTVIQHGNDLYDEAHRKNIIIVSPSTLIATLRTIASIWKHEYQSRNVKEIARQGADLYDKFVGFVEDLTKVGVDMDRAKKSYEGAMNKLVHGNGNLIRRTEKLRQLGAKPKKEIDPRLLERSEEVGMETVNQLAEKRQEQLEQKKEEENTSSSQEE